MRSDFKYILATAKLVVKNLHDPSRAALEDVAESFSKAGGSWLNLFKGSTEQNELLQKVIAKAHKEGILRSKDSLV